MKISDDQIKKYFRPDTPIPCRQSHLQEPVRQAHIQETILRSKAAFCAAEAEDQISGAEFVYLQSKYIHKHWWLLQGSILVILWILLEVSESSIYIRRCMGAGAPMFAILLLPELWKNRNANAMEVEGTACYSIRQIYAARIFLCAMVDFLLLGSFSAATVLTGKLLMEEILLQFFLPYTVTCCICFRTLYSRSAASEAMAVLLCTVWSALWLQIGLTEKIYESISPLLALAVTMTALFYSGYCVYRGQRSDFTVHSPACEL